MRTGFGAAAGPAVLSFLTDEYGEKSPEGEILVDLESATVAGGANDQLVGQQGSILASFGHHPGQELQGAFSIGHARA